MSRGSCTLGLSPPPAANPRGARHTPRALHHTPGQAEPRAKMLRQQVKKAFGLGKKLEEKLGQLIYKGMPG